MCIFVAASMYSHELCVFMHKQLHTYYLPDSETIRCVPVSCQAHALKKINKQHLLITFLYTISSTSTI